MAISQFSSASITGSKKYNNFSGKWSEALAVGGDEVIDIDGFRVHTFLTSGSFNIVWAKDYEATIEFLVVGGGGGGRSGGGGAGGFRAGIVGNGLSGRDSVYESPLTLPVGTYSIEVGAGAPSGGTGSLSKIDLDTLITAGGGNGGDRGSNNAGSGGCGGGGGSSNPTGFSGGAGQAGQGFNGGGGGPDAGFDGWSGGGGGAGAGGSSGGTGSESGKYGGPGQEIWIRGVQEYFAGGGGPARFTGGGITPGGIGGGGDRGQAGEINTGGGGGAGAAGGSGLVILRYKV